MKNDETMIWKKMGYFFGSSNNKFHPSVQFNDKIMFGTMEY